MAKPVKEVPVGDDGITTKKAFLKVFKQAQDADAEISEVKGELGSAVKAAHEDCNLHKDAFRIVRKFHKKNPDQRSAFWQAFAKYWDYLGMEKETLFDASSADADADETTTSVAQSDSGSQPQAEALGHGNKAIRGGKVVPIGNGASV